MKKLYYLIVLTSLPLLVEAQAPITVSDTMSHLELVQSLVGIGVQVSNISVTCPTGAYGSFKKDPAGTFGIDSGVVLTSGTIQNAVGPNTSTNITGSNGAPGDADLDSILAQQGTFTSNDACVLEFDLIPFSDTLIFEYVFGSDEYMEYVNSTFNDVFGFFISGPGITGKQNIALIPGTNISVSINTVNEGYSGPCVDPGPGCTNCAYYDNNCSGVDLEYDGLTVVLEAKVPVVQCAQYHLKLAVADAGDFAFDSGVFIEAGSLSSSDIELEVSTSAGANFPYAIEGCNPGQIKFTRRIVTPDSLQIFFSIAGSADNGTDYNYVPNYVVIPGNQASGYLDIIPIIDGLPEGTETVVLYLINPCNAALLDSVVLYIKDHIEAVPGPNQTICRGDSVKLTAGGGTSFLWSPSASLDDDTLRQPIAFPADTTIYTVVVSAHQCKDTTNVTVFVKDLPNLDAGPDTAICIGDSLLLIGTGGIEYDWSPTATLADPFNDSTWAYPNTTTTYYFNGVGFFGCTSVDSVLVTVNSLPTVIAGADTTICIGQNAYLSATGAESYNWLPTTNLNDPQSQYPIAELLLESTVYTVTGTDVNQCTNQDSMGVSIIPLPSVDAGSGASVNYGDEATLSGTVGGITFTWSPTETLLDPGSLTTQALPEVTTVYTLCTTSSEGCQNCDTVTIEVKRIGNIFVPNTFTPNGDGYNDHFMLISQGFVIVNSFRIYNRWGEQIFETTDPDFFSGTESGWDGTVKGKEAPIGVYSFVFIGEDGEGTELTASGNVTLLR